MSRWRRRRDDTGSSAIEVVGAVIVAGAVLVGIAHALMVVIGVHVAHQAARDGARAMSLGRSVPVAVAQSVPGDQVYRIEYPAPDTVRVEVRVTGPLGTMDVARQVAMPRTTP